MICNYKKINDMYVLVFTCPAGVDGALILTPISTAIDCNQWDVFIHRLWNLCWSN